MTPRYPRHFSHLVATVATRGGVCGFNPIVQFTPRRLVGLENRNTDVAPSTTSVRTCLFPSYATERSFAGRRSLSWPRPSQASNSRLFSKVLATGTLAAIARWRSGAKSGNGLWPLMVALLRNQAIGSR
jgi:hypothetical protein